MEIRQVANGKKEYLDLLLLGDEQEDMIDRYLGRGALFVLEDGGVCAVCVVTDEGGGTFEVKNIAVYPQLQKRGYGRALLEHAAAYSRARGARTLLVGTGDSPLTVPFYLHCGFVPAHRIKNFFIDHYDHPIFEAGHQLVDMVYFKKKL